MVINTNEVNAVRNKTPLENYKDLLSVDDLAQIFGVCKKTIYNEIREGKFGKPIKIGRAFKVPKIYVINRFITNYQ